MRISFFTPMFEQGKVGSMTHYDKAGRYLIKRAPAGFLRWLVGKPDLAFHAWLDARRAVLPNQGDLTHDLLAAVATGATLEGICLELEAEARADALARVWRYLVAFWTEPGARDSVALECASGVILDLTGRSRAHQVILESAVVPGARMELTVLRRHLADEDAARVLGAVAVGEISLWLLGWVPLMRGCGESNIITAWRAHAERLLTDQRDRADLGTLTLTFATLGGCRAAWERGLRGWNMQTSPFLDEIRAKVRHEAQAEGRAEGVRTTLLELGRRAFGKPPSKKQQKVLEGITDPGQLQALAARLFDVRSWTELLQEGERGNRNGR